MFITHLAPGKKANCLFTRLETLKETPLPLKNPAISINGKTVTLPVTLEPDAYLEFMGDSIVKAFDANGFDAGKADVPETISVKSGQNKIKFLCDTDERYCQSARITIVTRGKPLR